VSRRTTAALALAAAALAGCGTGMEAQTYQQKGRQDSARADLNQLVVRNLHVQGPLAGVIPAGGDAVLTGSFVNQGGTADRLRDVTSDLATSVTLTLDGKPVTGIPVPAQGASGTWTAVLSGLTRDVRPGEYIPVSLTFATNGRTTLEVPVQTGDNGLIGREVAQDPYEHAGGGEGEELHGEGG
jgi:copper(I)-binding protein